ncbi:MAG: DUF6293 family protein [Methanolinea sp.]|nr:DUF6293 family protein [Methanolinea sp.]
MTYTHIVFVGHHKERLMESIRSLRKYPVERVILVLGEDDTSGERISRNVASRVKAELAPLYAVSMATVDKRDVVRAASQLVDMILKEKRAGARCILNMSGSLRTFAIAAYIAGCITGSPMITSIPRYDEEDREVGVEEIIELPRIPVQFPRKDQAEVLAAIAGGSETFEEVVARVNPRAGESAEEMARERSRVSHHVKRIEELGLVTREKAGKQVVLSLSPLGRLFAKVCAAGG